jgi:hypothetical protein
LTTDDIRRYLTSQIEAESRRRPLPPAQLRQVIDEVLESRRAAFSKTAPPAVRILCDTQDRIWLNRFATDVSPLGFSSQWLVVDDGGESRHVRFPVAFVPYEIGEALVYGIQHDSLGVERVATVALGALAARR